MHSLIFRLFFVAPCLIIISPFYAVICVIDPIALKDMLNQVAENILIFHKKSKDASKR